MPSNLGTPSPLSALFSSSIQVNNFTTFTQKERVAAAKDKFLFFNKDTGQYEIKDIKERAKDLRATIEDIVKNTQPWPQVVRGSSLKVPGFLPPILISPVKDFRTDPSTSFDTAGDFIANDKLVLNKYGEYEFVDWRGYKIKPGGSALESILDVNTTDNRFKESVPLPRADFSSLKDKPYSTRDYYLIFNDNSTDYFRHGLQIIDNNTEWWVKQ
jgi:hypothetical protein